MDVQLGTARLRGKPREIGQENTNMKEQPSPAHLTPLPQASTSDRSSSHSIPFVDSRSEEYVHSSESVGTTPTLTLAVTRGPYLPDRSMSF